MCPRHILRNPLIMELLIFYLMQTDPHNISAHKLTEGGKDKILMRTILVWNVSLEKKLFLDSFPIETVFSLNFMILKLSIIVWEPFINYYLSAVSTIILLFFNLRPNFMQHYDSFMILKSLLWNCKKIGPLSRL